MGVKKAARRELAKKVKRVYRFEFPKGDVDWYAKKTGSVVASSRAEAKRKLVKRGLLEPFEAKVADIVPLRTP